MTLTAAQLRPEKGRSGKRRSGAFAWPRGSLASRIAASCLLVAVVAVGAATLVSLRLVGVTAQEVTRDVLARQADVVAAQLADAPPSNLGIRRVADVLRGQGISVVLIGPRGGQIGGDDPAATAVTRTGAARAAEGTPVSGQATIDGTTLLVEARPARNGAFALVETTGAAPAVAPQLRRNIGFALLAGTGTAIVVGLLAGRVLARPLRRTAAGARLLRSGRRDVRVEVAGPAEVADVAGAVNELADALQQSEGRQRRFLLSISHELRTPLTTVTGFAESLADSVVTGNDVPEVGRTVLREAHRLNRLVDDLLELARLEADDFRLDVVVLDLVVLAAEAADVWAARCAGVGVVFHRAAPQGPVLVRADPRRLRQVVDGLADNALRVTPAGGPLVLAVSAVPGGGVVEVRDGGPGLAADDYRVVFERGALHERYRERRGAGGIGLALAHDLVTRMGGEISAAPAVEGGVRFAVRLPANDPHDPKQRVDPGAGLGPPAGQQRADAWPPSQHRS